MVELVTQKAIRGVRRLSFCYLCRKSFADGDELDDDHVPPKSIFAPVDRQPLILRTHKACNRGHQLLDEKIGELIGLKRESPSKEPKSQRLKFSLSPDLRKGAVTNVNIDEAVWRWIRGFHAALYREPFPEPWRGALVTPFPRAQKIEGAIVIEALKPQHARFVEMIKWNRAKRTLDRIVCNKGKLVYECVWGQADDGSHWLCFFAIDVYDWKDLGRTPTEPARGCAGVYVRDSAPPTSATVGSSPTLQLPNYDPLDPFGS